jgi:Trm5-related predicted tRNA methylase
MLRNVNVSKLPKGIDLVELEEIQAKAARRREAEAMVREIMGEKERPQKSWGEFFRTYPHPPILDVDDSVFDRHAESRTAHVPE